MGLSEIRKVVAITNFNVDDFEKRVDNHERIASLIAKSMDLIAKHHSALLLCVESHETCKAHEANKNLIMALAMLLKLQAEQMAYCKTQLALH